MDKIITSFQTLIRGVVYLNDLKRSKEPAYEVLIHEIDTDKVQALVEMGFSQVFICKFYYDYYTVLFVFFKVLKFVYYKLSILKKKFIGHFYLSLT